MPLALALTLTLTPTPTPTLPLTLPLALSSREHPGYIEDELQQLLMMLRQVEPVP